MEPPSWAPSAGPVAGRATSRPELGATRKANRGRASYAGGRDRSVKTDGQTARIRGNVDQGVALGAGTISSLACPHCDVRYENSDALAFHVSRCAAAVAGLPAGWRASTVVIRHHHPHRRIQRTNVYHCRACGFSGLKNGIGPREAERVVEHATKCAAGTQNRRDLGRQAEAVSQYIEDLSNFDAGLL